MAHVDTIRWHHATNRPNAFKADVSLKPSGTCTVEVDVPPDFMSCLLKMARLAADKHEQEMRAQILADAAKETVHE